MGAALRMHRRAAALPHLGGWAFADAAARQGLDPSGPTVLGLALRFFLVAFLGIAVSSLRGAE